MSILIFIIYIIMGFPVFFLSCLNDEKPPVLKYRKWLKNTKIGAVVGIIFTFPFAIIWYIVVYTLVFVYVILNSASE